MPNYIANQELFDMDKFRTDLQAFADRYRTQKALAELIGIHEATLSRMLKGGQPALTIETLFRTCIMLQVNPAHYCREPLAEYVPEMHGLSYLMIISNIGGDEHE